MRRWLGGAVVALALAGCGVRSQDEPQPIDQHTPRPTQTPSIDRDTCSATPSASPVRPTPSPTAPSC